MSPGVLDHGCALSSHSFWASSLLSPDLDTDTCSVRIHFTLINQSSNFCWATASAQWLAREGQLKPGGFTLLLTCAECLGCEQILKAHLFLEGWWETRAPGTASMATENEVWVWCQPSEGHAAAMKHRYLPSGAHSQIQMLSCVSSRCQNPWDTREDLSRKPFKSWKIKWRDRNC